MSRGFLEGVWRLSMGNPNVVLSCVECLDVSEGQVRTSQVKISKVRTGQVRTGQDRFLEGVWQVS